MEDNFQVTVYKSKTHKQAFGIGTEKGITNWEILIKSWSFL